MIPAIEGAENLTASRLLEEIRQGARFTMYTTCVSLLVTTLRQPSRIQYLSPHCSPLVLGFRYAWPTLLMGWWGLPWGPIHTVESLLNYFHGGTDLTQDVLKNIEHVFQSDFGTPEELQALKNLGSEMADRRG